tara:strand:+ start:78 stop:461 length:384 start_codon:yes stop_codon:yes gene_type:complete
MKMLFRISCSLFSTALLFFVTAVGVSINPVAQIGKDSEFNKQQRMGHAFFMQRCSFCHVPRTTKAGADSKVPSGGLLTSLFQKTNSSQEMRVKQTILKGIPGKMPGFEHTLKLEEIDAIIAYIKTLN